MKNAIYYVMLFTVILTWGIDPVINSLFYKHYSAAALFSLFSVGACWLLITEALRNISPTFVAISNPLSAVITGIVSLIFDFDKLTLNFAIGSVLIVLAMTLSALPEKNESAIRDDSEM